MQNLSVVIGCVLLCGALLLRSLGGLVAIEYPDLVAGVVCLGAASLWLVMERARVAAQRRPVAVRIRR